MPSYRIPSPHDRPPFHRRASGLALALGVNLLLLLALLGLGAKPPALADSAPPLVIDLIRESTRSAPAPAPAETRPSAAARPVPKPPPIILPVKPTIAPPPERPLDMLIMTPEEYAAADIARLPKAGAGSGSAGDSEEVGRGPNGEVLYAAEWARRPTDAELGGYLPANAPEGWGLIACRTISGNRVDDCIELGQSPRGSHLASAVRQAAWQFRVRPPRKNGRPMVGEWVQIRIDYLRTARE